MSSSLTREQTIQRYYPLVCKIAYRMASRLPNHIDVEDLIHVGVIGLIEAINKYDSTKMASFDVYLKIRLQGAMVDELRRSDWVPRSVRDRVSQLEHARRHFMQKNKRAPSLIELAKQLDLSLPQLENMIRYADVRVIVSVDDKVNEDMHVSDFIRDTNPNPAVITEQKSFSDSLQKVIKSLPEREQIIVELYYFQEKSFKEIASILQVTESRISQIHSQIKSKLSVRLSSLKPS